MKTPKPTGTITSLPPEIGSGTLYEAATALLQDYLQFSYTAFAPDVQSAKDVLGDYFQEGKPPFDWITELQLIGAISDDSIKRGNRPSLYDGMASQTGTRTIANLPPDYPAVIVAAFELSKAPTRTQLATLTRAMNRRSKGIPVMVMFRYQKENGKFFTLAAAERTPFTAKHKVGQGERVGKVSLIYNISASSPHPGHLQILQALGPERAARNLTSFREFMESVRQVFDVQLLNKRFYDELYIWYTWACSHIELPPIPEGEKTDEEKLRALFVIRLLTRLLFVWFVKEKGLVPASLFGLKNIKQLLKNFDPNHPQSSEYYKAILQNLFFATLNSKMESDRMADNETEPSRRFAKTGGVSKDYTSKQAYRHKELFADPNTALKEFETVPFMNGGLFECLDGVDVKANKEYRYDGFSVSKTKQPSVPNQLFFGEKMVVDIADELGYKPKRATQFRGLIHILEAYKFTIEESTPLEEEVALDPELLGKVFENLLASYNDETKTTARKQTGSFYTPREVVSFMVDEALRLHLAKALGIAANKLSEPEAGQTMAKLKQLLDPGDPATIADQAFPFSKAEAVAMVDAISNCKVLDPAVGSGAFPMGMLHQMVRVLAKLDPMNDQWKHLKEKEAKDEVRHMEEKYTGQAGGQVMIDGAKQRLIYIQDSFNKQRHALDYQRKLYLIRDCLFGVDIQQIGIQICKLRFFISLVLEQEVIDSEKNRNILPMPNLEGGFIAANTLIAPSAKSLASATPQIEELEKQRKDIAKRFFFERDYASKQQLKEKDAAIGHQLVQLYTKLGFDTDAAKQVAFWNRYDVVHAAGFFAAGPMLGRQEKGADHDHNYFDIVLGNPPYVQLQKLGTTAEGREYKIKLEAQEYNSFNKSSDLYVLFVERGVQLLKAGGVLAFITSNKWMRANYGKEHRQFLIRNTRIHNLIDLAGQAIFETATVDTNILVLSKEAQPNQNNAKAAPVMATKIGENFKRADFLANYVAAEQVRIEGLTADEGWVVQSKMKYELTQYVKQIGTPLNQKPWEIEILRGILTGYNDAFIITKDVRDALIAEDPKSAEILHPMLRGRDIKPWRGQQEKWLIGSHNGYDSEDGRTPPIKIAAYPAIKKWLDGHWKAISERGDKGVTPYNLRNCAYWEAFMEPKIVYPNMTAFLPFCYSKDGVFTNQKAFIIIGSNLCYLTALCSSEIFKAIHKDFFPELGSNRRETNKVVFEALPILYPDPNKYPRLEETLSTITEYLSWLHQESPAGAEGAALCKDYIEEIMNGVVLEAYFPAQFAAEEIAILQHLPELPALPPTGQMPMLYSLVRELFATSHSLRRNLYNITKVAEVKFIKEEAGKVRALQYAQTLDEDED